MNTFRRVIKDIESICVIDEASPFRQMSSAIKAQSYAIGMNNPLRCVYYDSIQFETQMAKR